MADNLHILEPYLKKKSLQISRIFNKSIKLSTCQSQYKSSFAHKNANLNNKNYGPNNKYYWSVHNIPINLLKWSTQRQQNES